MFILLCFLIFNSLSDVVTITGHPEYQPIIWKDNKNVLRGTSVLLVKKAIENIGHTPHFVSSPTWARAQKQVINGSIDILLPPYKTTEREKVMVYGPSPLYMDKTVIFHKKGKEIKFETFSDLKKYKGVAIINDSFGTEFDKVNTKYKLLTRLSKSNQSFKFLILGRADYFVAGYNAGISIANKLGIRDKIDVHKTIVTETGMYSPISKKSKFNNKHFKKRFFSEINRLIKEKEHVRINKVIQSTYFQLNNNPE